MQLDLVDMLVCFAWIIAQLPDQQPSFLAAVRHVGPMSVFSIRVYCLDNGENNGPHRSYNYEDALGIMTYSILNDPMLNSGNSSEFYRIYSQNKCFQRGRNTVMMTQVVVIHHHHNERDK